MKIGTPVIINTCDAPCAKLVAIVSKVTPDRIEALYLTNKTNMRKCYTSRINNVTPIVDFGVKLIVDNTIMRCDVVGESTAKYEDGKNRRWQPNGCETYQTNAKALELYLANLKD